MNTAKFYNWERDASRTGLLGRGVSTYYADSKYLYTVRVNEETHTLPVLTTPHWLDRRMDIDSVLGEHDSDHVLDSVDMDAVRSRVQRIAYWDHGEPISDPNIDEYIWNSEVIQPHLTLETPELETSHSTYFSTLTQDERLTGEMATLLYNAGLSTDATSEQVQGVINTHEFPARDRIAPSLPTLVENLEQTPVPFGVNVATVFNTGAGYELVLAERGETVAVQPGKRSVLPAGSIEPGPDDTPSAYWTTLREYGEELFGVREGTDILDHEAVVDLRTLLDDDTAHLDFLGLNVAASRLGVNIMAVLFIDDPEYYQTHVADGLEYNWEAGGGANISLTDDAGMQETLDPDECVPPHIVCIYEALMHLDEEYDVPTELMPERIFPQEPSPN